MKNKLTAILALLLAAIMLAGCAGSVETSSEEVYADTSASAHAIQNGAAETVQNMTAKEGKTMPQSTAEYGERELHHIIKLCQTDTETYAETEYPVYTYEELNERAMRAITRCENVDDVTPMIPLYLYEEVLNLNSVSDEDRKNGRFGVGCLLTYMGAQRMYGLGEHPLTLREVLHSMPDAAVVYDPDKRAGYMMYDLDNGMRLFYFFKDTRGYRCDDILDIWIQGMPVIMAQKTSYSSFADLIQENMSITELAGIDPAFEAYKSYMTKGYFNTAEGMNMRDEDGKITSESYAAMIAEGNRLSRIPASTLILTDGVLRVEWDWCQERSEYVVLRYLYKKDFVLRLYRMEINYKIDSRYYVGKVKKKGGKIWIAGNEQITIL